MVEIIFHPLNHSNPFFDSNGIEISLEEILRRDSLGNGRKIEVKSNFRDPLYSRETVKVIELLINTISGYDLFETDRAKIKMLLERIKIGIKKDAYDLQDRLNSPEFVFGTLPYVFTGFNLDRCTKVPHDGQNTLESVYEICKILCRGGSRPFSTFLCAHKARRNVDQNGLINHLNLEAVQRALNVIGGMIDNSAVESVQYTFYQPGGNSQDIHFVFPPLLNKYLSEGRVSEMFSKLDDHVQELQNYLSRAKTRKISFNAKNLDEILRKAEKIKENLDDEVSLELFDISENLTKKSISRVYGEFKEVNYENFTGISIQEKEVQKILQLSQNQKGLSQKAIYETAIYYCWGLLMGQKKGVGIGLEIDHEKYQTLAWDLGWKRGSNTNSFNSTVNSPLIYARKNRKAEGQKYLKGLSLRESWR